MPRADGSPTIAEMMAGMEDEDLSPPDTREHPCPGCDREIYGPHRFRCPYGARGAKTTLNAPLAPALTLPPKGGPCG